MGGMRWVLVAIVGALVLCLQVAPGPARAEDQAEAEPQGALELGFSVLRLRVRAQLLEAQLLARAGRPEEALAATREVERLYREGMEALRRMVAAVPAVSVPLAPSPTDRVAPDAGGEFPDADTQPLVSAFQGRGAKSSRGTGGRPIGIDATLHGLRWLAAHQSPDGAWEAAGFGRWCDGKPNPGLQPDGPGKPTYDVGVTALALCAFLADGYTHRGDHEFAKVVGAGLAYLRRCQDPEGHVGPRTSSHTIYNHMIATLALVEAYGMTDAPNLKRAAQRGLDLIASSRNPSFGWRYGVRPELSDTSVTAWAISALHSARLVNQADAKAGRTPSFRIDDAAFEGARAWLDAATDPVTGRVGYIARGGGSARPQELMERFPPEQTEAMTAAGIWTRILLGEHPARSAPILKGTALLRRRPPVWNTTDGSIDMYAWYYGALVAFQVGGEMYLASQDALKRQILAHQRMDGLYCGLKGSWDPVDPWGPDGGRVYATAMMVLCCEARQRYERFVR